MRRIAPRVQLCRQAICRLLREHYKDDPRHLLYADHLRAKEDVKEATEQSGGERASRSRRVLEKRKK